MDSLIQAGADINAKDGNGQTALTMAAKQGNYESRSSHRMKLEQCITYFNLGHFATVDLLIQRGAIVNTMNDQVALISAAENGNREFTKSKLRWNKV